MDQSTCDPLVCAVGYGIIDGQCEQCIQNVDFGYSSGGPGATCQSCYSSDFYYVYDSTTNLYAGAYYPSADGGSCVPFDCPVGQGPSYAEETDPSQPVNQCVNGQQYNSQYNGQAGYAADYSSHIFCPGGAFCTLILSHCFFAKWSECTEPSLASHRLRILCRCEPGIR